MNNGYLGIDLGGTQIRGAVLNAQSISERSKSPALAQWKSEKIPIGKTVDDVLNSLMNFISSFDLINVRAIGIGVPGLVDHKNDRVIDVLNIHGWKDVPLRSILEEKFQIPVAIENDANCFALGEYHFGKRQKISSLVGVTIGTGLGTGIIINGKIYRGANGAAGEFGMMDYNGKFIEYFVSGQFFKNTYGVDGESVFAAAQNGDSEALMKFEEFGKHFSEALKMILYSLDPELIVLGGSISQAFPLFEKAMNEGLKSFAYKSSIDQLKIEVSAVPNAGVLGACLLVVSG